LETIRAFGKIKCTDAVPDLKALLADPDEEVRNEITAVLKELTGKVFQAKKGEVSGPKPGLVTQVGSPAEGSTLTEAIVVLDLCNSTDIAARYGDNFALKLMKTLKSLITPIAQHEQAQFAKNTGDGYLMTFPKARNAVQFAVGVMNEIQKHNANIEKAYRIDLRVSINFGETRLDDHGDRVGVAVNMGFRVDGLGPDELIPVEGGMTKEEVPVNNRILLTENIVKEIEGMEEMNVRLVGLFELKGITGLHRIYHMTSQN